jgi:biopolymer transport protein TolR
MSLSGPGGGDDFDSEDAGGFSDINITPLTDIFLVLLIIFMVTSSVIVNSSNGAKAGLKVNLPQGGSADVATQANDLSVAVLSDGRLVLGGDVVTEDELKKAFEDARAKSADTMVVVQADEGVPHGKVVEVMELAKGAGLGQLAIGVRDSQK